MENKPDIGFDKIIDALLDLNNAFPPKYLHRFSDIPQMDLSSLQKVWNLIVDSRKTENSMLKPKPTQVASTQNTKEKTSWLKPRSSPAIKPMETSPIMK